MSGYYIRNMKLDEIKNIYENIKSDFAKGEYPPYDILYKQIQSGVQTGLLLRDGCKDVGYSICADQCNNGFVLISLFSIYKEFRGLGIGRIFLDELRKYYSNKNGIIVEVERPEDSISDEEREVRRKRIAFYQKSGFYLLPKIEYKIWDVPMHLMIMPQSASVQVVNDNMCKIMYEIYFELMGKGYMDKLVVSSKC